MLLKSVSGSAQMSRSANADATETARSRVATTVSRSARSSRHRRLARPLWRLLGRGGGRGGRDGRDPALPIGRRCAGLPGRIRPRSHPRPPAGDSVGARRRRGSNVQDRSGAGPSRSDLTAAGAPAARDLTCGPPAGRAPTMRPTTARLASAASSAGKTTCSFRASHGRITMHLILAARCGRNCGQRRDSVAGSSARAAIAGSSAIKPGRRRRSRRRLRVRTCRRAASSWW